MINAMVNHMKHGTNEKGRCRKSSCTNESMNGDDAKEGRIYESNQ